MESLSTPPRSPLWGENSPLDDSLMPLTRPSAIFGPSLPIAAEPIAPPVVAALGDETWHSDILAQAAMLFANADYLTATYDLNAQGMVELHDAIIVPQWSQPFGQLLLSQLLVTPHPSNVQVLDVACGTGYPTLDIARYLGQNADVAGVDTWMLAIEHAKRKATTAWLRNVSFLHGDIAHFAMPEEHFDIVTSNLGYTSFADRARALAVMTRLTRPNGWVLLTTPLQTAFREFLDIYHNVLSELALTSSVDALVALVKGRPTVASTRAAVERTGLVVEREVTDRHVLTFIDARDFLTSPIIALNFMIGWRAIVPDVALRRLVFNEIERRLNIIATTQGELRFEVPMLCLSTRRDVR